MYEGKLDSVYFKFTFRTADPLVSEKCIKKAEIFISETLTLEELKEKDSIFSKMDDIIKAISRRTKLKLTRDISTLTTLSTEEDFLTTPSTNMENKPEESMSSKENTTTVRESKEFSSGTLYQTTTFSSTSMMENSMTTESSQAKVL